MKRLNNLYQQICSIENLQLADKKARVGKGTKRDIIAHDENREANIIALHEKLIARTYRTSKYSVFKIYEPKERDVYKLPYYPDRIVHHAIMNILEPVFVSMFTADTFCCIKGRGIYAAANKIRKALRIEEETRYCLKLDIKKFYPNIDHNVLKVFLQNKFKDKDLLWLLSEIIDSAEGLPIGNYTSQYFANFYLTQFDHWIKEVLKVKNYFRYADDIVILAGNKAYLHKLLSEIRIYVCENLHLTIKDNYQVFPVAARGVDVVGYKFFHEYTLLRKTIKKNFARMLAKNKNPESIAAYYGWVKHCNGAHLMKKLLRKAS